MAEESKSSETPRTNRSGTTLHTVWPTVAFQGEDFPTITLEGTAVNSTEAKAAQDAAEAQGVALVEGS